MIGRVFLFRLSFAFLLVSDPTASLFLALYLFRFISSFLCFSFASLSFADLLSRCFVSCGTILLFTGFLLRKHLYFFTLFPSREAASLCSLYLCPFPLYAHLQRRTFPFPAHFPLPCLIRILALPISAFSDLSSLYGSTGCVHF